MLHPTHLITYGHFDYCISATYKKIQEKSKGFALMLASNCFINEYVHFAKSQFLFISKMLKIKLSLKFGKIIRNCLRNSAVGFGNYNENYNVSGKLVNENLLSQLILNIDCNKTFEH